MHSFTIKDLESLSGIKAHTIRIWEQRFSFLKPNRTTTNIRYYSGEELKTILNVALLNKYGYKISNIDKMNTGEINEKILQLNQSEAKLDRVVNSLIEYMVDLDIDSFEKVLDGYIQSKGIEKTISQVIFPYLEKIGVLWLTNHINPAQEHMVSNIIRQKLIVGIQNAGSQVDTKKSVLLFLPEGEYHELGLLFMCYLLKNKGVTVYYLGCSSSLNDVEFVSKLKKPDYLYTHLTTANSRFDLDKYLTEIAKKFPDIKIVISGQLTNSFQKKVQSHIIFKRSYSEIMEFVSSL